MSVREKVSMDSGWRFHYGDIVSIRNRWAWGKSGSWNQGPEGKRFDDSKWQEVELPHDFLMGTEPIAYEEQEFDEDNAIPAMEDVKNIHTTAGSFQKSVGWYRKHFFIPAEDEGKKIYIVFEGIYRDSAAWLNEFFIGSERSGYKQIVYDITDFVNYGGDNLISVKADARGSEGWFYEGGGIYRHAYLLKTAQEHIESVFVHSRVNLEDGSAEVSVEVELAECGGMREPAAAEKIFADGKAVQSAEIQTDIGVIERALSVTVLDPNGALVWEQTVNAKNDKIVITFPVSAAKLWDTEHPHLYQAVVSLKLAGEEKDEDTVRFGIRDIRFDADKGFLLNGVQTKIKGVCCHQNHGGIGTAVPDEVYRYRVRCLKEMGANGYRASHYPPSPKLLDICDEEGMLVMDETRLLSSEKGDLEQLRCMVKRDRNHPSVILYSIGNEEAQSQATPQGGRIAGTMIKEIKRLDPYTPVTMALLMWDLKRKTAIESHDVLAPVFTRLDVAGFNYHHHRWEEFHRQYPDKPMICTEQGTFKSTRGCYETDRERCHLAVTDRTSDSYMKGAEQWRACRPDWVSGLFLWTGFDYYGEPTPFAYPAVSSQFGAMDLCGYPKDFYYYYQAWWTKKDVLHIFPNWNGTPGQKRDMHVFSNCEEVELFVNGASCGRKTMARDGYLVWEGVTYQPGSVSAVGYRGGMTVCSEEVRTAGMAERVKLTVTYAEGDIKLLCAEALDAEGLTAADGDVEITFEMSGGRILGTSNGDPSDHALPNGNVRRTFHGKAQVIVAAKSPVTITAKTVTIGEDSLTL